LGKATGRPASAGTLVIFIFGGVFDMTLESEGGEDIPKDAGELGELDIAALCVDCAGAKNVCLPILRDGPVDTRIIIKSHEVMNSRC
jgi:hypothetical protein